MSAPRSFVPTLLLLSTVWMGIDTHAVKGTANFNS